ncbi:uncharacterized protein PgNI_12102 [Pyricularia grisea]|uniref:FAD-binding FR-type domain-containing protein n=1 Tax=Pyricularia grisea TaxID=148305 RepID=A0A6P8AQS7_PYRGI|nr:uncharacterized protein PgNI_12102 [Pyricularia grisea]TLD04391.1 hypothetical protein PgNI_12102 [Pyricularia grisea]
MVHRLALFDLFPTVPLGRPPICRPRHYPLYHVPGRLYQFRNILYRYIQALLDLGYCSDLCLVILLFYGVLWLRRASYEIFLILHILLAVFTIIGCWYHGFTGIYKLWIYLVYAVWFFDRLVRMLRVAKNGVYRATVTEILADTVRVNVAGVRWTFTPGRHARCGLRKTTPFLSSQRRFCGPVLTFKRPVPPAPLKKKTRRVLTTSKEVKTAGGISLFIRKYNGITRLLRRQTILPVLLDGPYRGTPTYAVFRYDRVLLIGGGIGVTGLLGWAERAESNGDAYIPKNRCNSGLCNGQGGTAGWEIRPRSVIGKVGEGRMGEGWNCNLRARWLVRYRTYVRQWCVWAGGIKKPYLN